MGYYSSLINRKFRDVVGNRYEGVLKDYKEFILTDEDLLKDVSTILLPLDIFVKDIPGELYDLFEIYDAEVTLLYITDKDVVSIVDEILGEEVAADYVRKKENYGHSLMDKISSEMNHRNIRSKSRTSSGQKWDDVEILSKDFDLVAISKFYGGGRGDEHEISPVAQRLVQQIRTIAVLY
ncbi:hypothetical protein J2128_001113 [Methanomicrobium sp. W14]|uniref:hypothetical protein n=1 Tax=Methanomicrobium sp. W14 TaxID=2817839 RepID=UPI001AE9D3DB|nr:hypothetical protein [Methanomicrobium sp. W14]MBP2133192.1 hypothetical protein [Methanomicrobium sp. W14]